MSPRGGGDRSPEEREAARRSRERKRLERAGEPIPDDLLEPHERPAAPPPPADPEPAFAPYAAEPPADPHAGEPAASERYAADPDAPAPPEQPYADEPFPPAPDPAVPSASHEPVPDPDAPAPPPVDAEQHTQQWDVNEAWMDDPQPPSPDDPPAEDPARRAERPAAEPFVPAGDEPFADAPPAGRREPSAVREEEPSAADPPARAAADPPADAPPTGEHEAPLGTRRVSGRHLPNVHRPAKGNARRERATRGRGVRVKRPGETVSGRPRKRHSVAGRIAGLVVVVLAIALVWFLVSLFQVFGGGGDGTGRVLVQIPQGASAGQIGDLLEDRGVIPSSFFFGVRASLSGDRGKLKSGRYTLRRDMSYGAALDALTQVEQDETAAVPVVSVGIPEGRSRRETARIASDAGLRGDYFTASRRSAQLDPTRYGAPRGATLEGFLFPATYEVPRRARVQRLVDDQLRAFKANFAGVSMRRARAKNLTAFDVLTIASMVEREVSVARERPLVAAVIYNRLRFSIPLGIDATLRFEQNDWVNPLRQSVLDADTPYNTRIKQGLPPGPIGSPGLASIKAAANPARSAALYYVVKPNTCGEHVFAPNYEEHLRNVARYEAARQAAGGRSPTTC